MRSRKETAVESSTSRPADPGDRDPSARPAGWVVARWRKPASTRAGLDVSCTTDPSDRRPSESPCPRAPSSSSRPTPRRRGDRRTSLTGVGYAVETVKDPAEAIRRRRPTTASSSSTSPARPASPGGRLPGDPGDARAWLPIPVLCLTQTDDVEERIRFLEAGADDVDRQALRQPRARGAGRGPPPPLPAVSGRSPPWPPRTAASSIGRAGSSPCTARRAAAAPRRSRSTSRSPMPPTARDACSSSTSTSSSGRSRPCSTSPRSRPSPTSPGTSSRSVSPSCSRPTCPPRIRSRRPRRAGIAGDGRPRHGGRASSGSSKRPCWPTTRSSSTPAPTLDERSLRALDAAEIVLLPVYPRSRAQGGPGVPRLRQRVRLDLGQDHVRPEQRSSPRRVLKMRDVENGPRREGHLRPCPTTRSSITRPSTRATRSSLARPERRSRQP